MKLLTLDIPDAADSLAPWLESHLLGLDLHQVVTELGIFGGSQNEPRASLQQILGEQTEEVLQLGLRSLSISKLRQLLRQPRLLLDLQRLVLDQGGAYWTSVPESSATRENRKTTWNLIQAKIQEESPKPAPVRSTLRLSWLWGSAGWISAAAAIVFAVFVQGNRLRHLESGLQTQVAQTDDLRKKLEFAQAAAPPLELPERETVHVSFIDDTPEGDPADLPS